MHLDGDEGASGVAMPESAVRPNEWPVLTKARKTPHVLPRLTNRLSKSGCHHWIHTSRPQLEETVAVASFSETLIFRNYPGSQHPHTVN